MKYKNLCSKANEIRLKVLNTAKKANWSGSHLGGTFSCIEILVALYYANILKIDVKKPNWVERDRLLIGKGHAHLALYHIWADIGFIDSAMLQKYGTDGSALGQQLNHKIPGSEYNTGSLGHVIGIGSGMALAAKLDSKRYYSYALVGDAECEEGSIWESVMFAGQNKLSNLITIVDRNWMSVMDKFEENSVAARLEQMFKSCNWEVKTVDGHDYEQLISVLKLRQKMTKPLVIIADTIKGKGVSFMENNINWHSGIPSENEYQTAIAELSYNENSSN